MNFNLDKGLTGIYPPKPHKDSKLGLSTDMKEINHLKPLFNLGRAMAQLPYGRIAIRANQCSAGGLQCNIAPSRQPHYIGIGYSQEGLIYSTIWFLSVMNLVGTASFNYRPHAVCQFHTGRGDLPELRVKRTLQ